MALARALSRAKDKKITIVAITQRPSLLQSVDRIMIIKDGTTQTIGKREDIIPLFNGRPPDATVRLRQQIRAMANLVSKLKLQGRPAGDVIWQAK